MKIPVLIWIPKFVYNNVAMICAIPFIPAENFCRNQKKFKPTAEVKAVIAITAIFYRFIPLVSTNQSTHFLRSFAILLT